MSAAMIEQRRHAWKLGLTLASRMKCPDIQNEIVDRGWFKTFLKHISQSFRILAIRLGMIKDLEAPDQEHDEGRGKTEWFLADLICPMSPRPYL